MLLIDSNSRYHKDEYKNKLCKRHKRIINIDKKNG